LFKCTLKGGQAISSKSSEGSKYKDFPLEEKKLSMYREKKGREKLLLDPNIDPCYRVYYPAGLIQKVPVVYLISHERHQ
jgi:hypothetical protein